MLNRIANLIDLTKNISARGVLYVENGIVYTYHKDQILQAVSDITADKKTIELGLEEGVFKITLDKFSEFVKTYKSEYTSFVRDGNNLELLTKKPRIVHREDWTCRDDEILQESKEFFKNLERITKDSERLIAEIQWSEDDITTFTKNNPVRFYLNFDDNILQFDRPDDDVSFLMISLLNSQVGKLSKSSKYVKTRIYSTDDDSTFYFNLEIMNGKCITQYYGITVDSSLSEGEGVNSCQ